MYHLVELCVTLTLNIGKRQGSSSAIFSPMDAMAQTAPIGYGLSWSVRFISDPARGKWPARLSTAEPSHESFRFTTFAVPPRWLFLKIETDEGVTGWGEPVVEGRAATPVAEFMGGTALISAASARSPAYTRRTG